MAHTAPAKPASTSPRSTFQPYVPASQSPAEFTVKAIILGALFGLIFGASTVYLGLRAGLDGQRVDSDRRARHLGAEAVRRLDHPRKQHRPDDRLGRRVGGCGASSSPCRRCSSSATVGRASSTTSRSPMLAFAGGILGVLMMVPLRRALIVKEHGVLPYPEGHGLRRRARRRRARRRARQDGVPRTRRRGRCGRRSRGSSRSFRTAIGRSLGRTSIFPNATLNVDISPEYMGVGYVIGPRIAGVMFAGGVLSWLVLLPLLSIMGNYLTVPFPPVPASGLRIDQMSPNQLWSAYIRYTGAGAVLAAGLITLARTIPTIVSSFRESMKDFSAKGTGRRRRPHRARHPDDGGARRNGPARHLPRGRAPACRRRAISWSRSSSSSSGSSSSRSRRASSASSAPRRIRSRG